MTIGHQTIVFNGEIYNFRELKAELSTLRPEHAWRTTGDTEVLLLAYQAWGAKCLDRLNGMFAFAIWDERDHSLFLARDRMGQKPLYYAFIGPAEARPGNWVSGERKVVAFASEPGALRALPWVSGEFSETALREYLRWGYVPLDGTIYTAIRQVSPAQSIVFRSDGHQYHWYFEHTPRPDGWAKPALSDGEARRRTKELVTEATRRQLVSDVPIGCFLSGGIDSSVIAAAMKASVSPGQDVLTFSIGFEDPRYDESSYAVRVAGHLKTKHHAFHVRPDATRDLPELVRVFGEPFGDSSALPTHYLAREARSVVKVALAGDGGDELFGGYDRYRAMAAGCTLRLLSSPLPWMAMSPLAAALACGHPKSRLARAGRFARSLRLPAAERYASYLRIFEESWIDRLVGAHPDEGDFIAGWFSCRRDRSSGLDVVRRAMAVDRDTYLPGDLLAKVDRCSMLHSLEVRSPFMDHELVRFAAGLTKAQLLGGGAKRMLREAFAGEVPDFVFKRRKMGFAVPIGEWFRGELKPMLRDHLFASDSFARLRFNMNAVQRLVDEHEQSRVDHSQRLYALLMLELWWSVQR
jgi:asparagine synthase (glutamine-hydrolysing)